MKAIKKPVEIDYFVYEKNIQKLEAWVNNFNDDFDEHFRLLKNQDDEADLKVITLEGSSYIVPVGYIIIRGIKGEYYPCESVIFNETYTKL